MLIITGENRGRLRHPVNVNNLKLIIINSLNIVPVLLIFKSKKVCFCIFRSLPKEQLTHTFYVATGGAKTQTKMVIWTHRDSGPYFRSQSIQLVLIDMIGGA